MRIVVGVDTAAELVPDGAAATRLVAKATIVVKNLVNMFAAIVEYCRL